MRRILLPCAILIATLTARAQQPAHRDHEMLVPLLTDTFLRRQNLDELAEFLGDDAPAHSNVAIERERLVLRRDIDAAQARVDAVAQGKVDDAVGTAEVHGGFGSFLGEREQAFAHAARKHNDQRVVE